METENGDPMSHWSDGAFLAHSNSIRRFLLLRLPAEEVDDALADIFEIAARSGKPESELAWLLGVAKNVCLRQHTQRYRQTDLIVKISQSEYVFQNYLPQDENSPLAIITEALSKLDVKAAELIELVYLLNVERSDIAKSRNVSKATLDVQVYRARQELRKAIDAIERDRD